MKNKIITTLIVVGLVLLTAGNVYQSKQIDRLEGKLEKSESAAEFYKSENKKLLELVDEYKNYVDLIKEKHELIQEDLKRQNEVLTAANLKK